MLGVYQQRRNQVLAWLYGGSDAEQAVAEVRFMDASRRVLCRKHVVTGAMLDEAVSAAKDACLRASADRGELVGLDAAGIIRSLLPTLSFTFCCVSKPAKSAAKASPSIGKASCCDHAIGAPATKSKQIVGSKQRTRITVERSAGSCWAFAE